MQQPGWWAAASSLGFHGLLFLVLSLLPAPPSLGEDIDSPRSVSVYDLSAVDAERLPNFSDLETSLPPLPDAPPPVANQPDVRIEPYQFDLGPNIIESQREFERSSPSSSTYDFSDLFSNLPAPNVLNRRPPVTVPRQQVPSLPQPEPIQPASPDEAVIQAPLPTPQQGTADDLRSPETAQSPDESTPEQADTPSDGAEQTSDEVARASDPPAPERMQLSEEQQAAYERLYTYSTEGTSGDEAQIAATTWLTEDLGLDISEVDTLRSVLNVSVDYPEDACVIGAEEGDVAAVYGVVLGEDGSVTNEPVLVRSSGYGVLNLVGKAVAADSRFEGVSGPKLVRVEFVYSDAACSASEAIAQDEATQNQAGE